MPALDGVIISLEKYGAFLNAFRQKVKRLVWRKERVKDRIVSYNVSVFFHQTCLKEKIQSRYSHTHTHTHIYIYMQAFGTLEFSLCLSYKHPVKCKFFRNHEKNEPYLKIFVAYHPYQTFFPNLKRNRQTYLMHTNTHSCIYIVIHRQTPSWYHCSMLELDTRGARSCDRTPAVFYASLKFHRTAMRKHSGREGILTHMYHLCFI